MRAKKPTNGRIPGVKFTLNKETEENDLKKNKEKILKELEEQEKNNKDWYDKEIDKNMKKL